MSGTFLVVRDGEWLELPDYATKIVGIRIEAGGTLIVNNSTLQFPGGVDIAILVEQDATLTMDDSSIT